MFQKEYIPPTLVVDSVVMQITEGVLNVLLIKRNNEPFKDTWALPGGYCAAGQTTNDAMSEILNRKAGVKTSNLKLVEQLYTFDTVARDPRGHAVSVTYMGLGIDIDPTISESTQNPSFFPVDNLPELAYDHKNIIMYAHQRLSAKFTYTNAAFSLLPKKFTLTQLQNIYEAVLERPLDKRNFRKKFLNLDLIHETGEQHREGAHRPAMLYEFNKQTIESLSRSFD